MKLLKNLFGWKEFSNTNVGPKRDKPDATAASVYLCGSRIVLHGSCITNIGQLACEPCRVLEATSTDAMLGETLKAILAAAKIAPVPMDSKAEGRKILQAAGVKSWRKLYECDATCMIWATSDQVSISPTKRWSRDAFVGLGAESEVIVSAECNTAELGNALRLGFSRCG